MGGGPGGSRKARVTWAPTARCRLLWGGGLSSFGLRTLSHPSELCRTQRASVDVGLTTDIDHIKIKPERVVSFSVFVSLLM